MNPCDTNKTEHNSTYQQVHERMLTLMPGWFTMLDETMNPEGPQPYIKDITNKVLKTNKPIDDVIHEEMYDEWFEYHDDYDEEW